MNNNILYYLNKGNTPNCPQIPTRYTNYLDRNNYLSEFITSTDKEIARLNLGIPDVVKELNYKIDAKVIDKGAISWDLTPTEGNTEKVLSSHALYNTLLKYTLKTELDNNIQLVWSDTILKINDTYNKVEEELNLLNVDLRAYTDEVKCSFDSFVTNMNQQFTNFTEHIVSEFTRLENETNTKISDLETLVNNKVLEFIELLNSKISEFTKFVNELVSQMRVEMTELKKDVQTTLDKFQEDKYVPLEARMKSIELQVETFLKSVAGGTALTDEFGTSEYIGVNQKVLTEAINKIWSKLEDMTGESYQGIDLTVTPEYFIGEDGTTVHIKATTVETNGIFEHIEFFINGTSLCKADNVDIFEYETEIDETSVIKVVAKILGIEYSQQKIITHYNSFWLGAGTSYSDIMDIEHVIPITNGMRGAYNVDVKQGEHIIVVVGESLSDGFIRADINSIEIPMNESTVTIDGNAYRVFTSVNTYIAGTYNIDING